MEEMDKVDYMDKVDGVLTTPFLRVSEGLFIFNWLQALDRNLLKLRLIQIWFYRRSLLIGLLRQPRFSRPARDKTRPTLLPRINASSRSGSPVDTALSVSRMIELIHVVNTL